MLADVQVTLAFHRVWLRMDAAEFGVAYGALIDKIQLTNQTFRKEALAAPPAGKDAEIEINPRHEYNQDTERDECLRRMQKHLRLSRNIF